VVLNDDISEAINRQQRSARLYGYWREKFDPNFYVAYQKSAARISKEGRQLLGIIDPEDMPDDTWH
jgi:hypothetical protein